jgi:5-hydroxyisourate hydrolase-like protein (transthyretin family)
MVMKWIVSVRRSVAYSIPLAILIVGGCGIGQSGHTADGLMTVGGKSAAFAELTLWSTSGSPATPVAMARTDEQGRFEFTSAAKLQAGEYAVTCKKFELPSGADLKSDEKPDEVGAINIVPEDYQVPGKSPLKIRIPSKGTALDLPKAVAAGG